MTTQARSSSAEARAHRDAVAASPQNVSKFLVDLLGVSLVAELAGVEAITVRRWMDGQNEPNQSAERRLRTAYQVSQLLLAADASHTVRAWFIGLNPQLSDDSPIEAITADQFRDVLAAARAFVEGA